MTSVFPASSRIMMFSPCHGMLRHGADRQPSTRVTEGQQALTLTAISAAIMHAVAYA